MACNCQEIAEKGKQKVEESLATVVLKEYKKVVKIIISILSAIILLLVGYIVYDDYMDSQYEYVEYTQDGTGYNNINTGSQGDISNGTKNAVSETQK